MASLAIPNTFAALTVITAAGHNQNNSAIQTYINDRNSGSVAWEALYATSSSAVPAIFDNSSGSSDILNCRDGGTNVFRVLNGGSIVCGSAAVATGTTDGLFYITSCAGTPTGTPTSFAGRVPMVYDTTNDKFYFYNSSWKQIVSAVDDSTIGITSNHIFVKNAGIGANQLAASIAGNGLSGGAGSALAVNVDNDTITIVADTLGVVAQEVGLRSTQSGTSTSTATVAGTTKNITLGSTLNDYTKALPVVQLYNTTGPDAVYGIPTLTSNTNLRVILYADNTIPNNNIVYTVFEFN